MIYKWDIDLWAQNELPDEVRNDYNWKWQLVLLKPLKVLYGLFMAYTDETRRRMRYNGQTIVLENLLNDMFDKTLRRIRITTASNLLDGVYIYTDGENTPLYIYTDAENKPLYIYTVSEYENQFDFVVEAYPGSLTPEQIIRLKAIVKYYKVAGKRPYYQYLVTQQPF